MLAPFQMKFDTVRDPSTKSHSSVKGSSFIKSLDTVREASAAKSSGRLYLPLDELISGTVPLDDINTGFERASRGEGIRTLVIP